ncbi:variant SH3 domain containing protein [Nitzschia inconspicua]|uniref:Variant SH3 domain containing protein n=1 Tax=Nitzschia inconspicua TaxID=303405 RepID=A0A9K3LJW8_9STRA|nr:variant SH3 domain containing protein [Nitzschia inconspicua]
MTKQQFTAKYDFVGDPCLHQLSFARNSLIKVNVEQKPKNGWLWGSCFERKGWFPAWAIDYDGTAWTERGEEGNQGFHRSACNICDPRTEERTIYSSAEEVSGFDLDKNDIMGGKTSRMEKRNDDDDRNDPHHATSNSKIVESPILSQSGRLFSRWRKQKINPFPFQQERAKTPEWTPEPQIVYEGRVVHDFSQTKKKGLFPHQEERDT